MGAMQESLAGRLAAWTVLGLVAAAVGGMLYAAIFRSKDWTHPAAARGSGIGALGLIVLAIGAVAKSNGSGGWTGAVEAAGAVIAVVGAAWAAWGLSDWS